MSVATTSKGKAKAPQNQQMLILGAIAVVAVIAVIALILMSGQVNTETLDYSTLQQERTPDGAFVLGSPDAPVTIVEFADFACPACQTYEPEVSRFIQEYVATGQARYEWRTFVTAGRELTAFAGGIAECIGDADQNSFWTARSRLFQLAQQGRYQDAPRIVASELNLNYSDLLACQQDSERVQRDMALGEQLGITGTPAVGIRYGDGPPQFVTYAGQVYNRGGVPFDVLAAVVTAANAG